MKQPRKHTALLFIALGIIALLLLVIDMATGDTYIPVSKVWAVLTGGECDEMTRNALPISMIPPGINWVLPVVEKLRTNMIPINAKAAPPMA